MINAIAINALLIFYALAALRRAESELEQQHKRSEALIETVMPSSIAARLKSGEERIADRIENLSVLFNPPAISTESPWQERNGGVCDLHKLGRLANMRQLDDALGVGSAAPETDAVALPRRLCDL
jgi:hypothetical protein